MGLANYSRFVQDYFILFAVAFVVFLLIIISTLFLFKFLSKKKSLTYTAAFSAAYDENKNVAIALEKAKFEFPEKSKERAAICNAIHYLSNSLLRDYETAFNMIEKRFRAKEVKAMHLGVLMKEKEKKKALLLLTAAQ